VSAESNYWLRVSGKKLILFYWDTVLLGYQPILQNSNPALIERIEKSNLRAQKRGNGIWGKKPTPNL
jgi:hypothetical protein